MKPRIHKKSTSKSQSTLDQTAIQKRNATSNSQLVNHSVQAKQLKAIQEIANNSNKNDQVARLQTIANSTENNSQLPLQKKENKTGLPNNLKTGIEQLSGYTMDDVKVHYNSSKPAQLNAHAYAQGTNIHVAPGQEKHVSHEAWHVVQQKQGRVKPTMQMKGGVNINDDKALEREADIMGRKASDIGMIQGGPSGLINSLELENVKPSKIQRKIATQLMAKTQQAVAGQISWEAAGSHWLDATQTLSSDDWSAVQRVAIDNYAANTNQGVAQLLGEGTWDMISDFVTIGSLVATATSIIAKAASASGIGWFVPIALGLVGKFAADMMKTWGKTSESTASDNEKRKQDTITSITTLLGAAAVGLVGVLHNSDDKTLKVTTSVITLAFMTVLEFLRVHYMTRESIYKVVWDKVKSLSLKAWDKVKNLKNGSGEDQSLLGT